MSGDIKEDYKSKDVTLVHPREILVNDKVSESFQKTIKDRLKLLGVKTVLGNSTFSHFQNEVSQNVLYISKVMNMEIKHDVNCR